MCWMFRRRNVVRCSAATVCAVVLTTMMAATSSTAAAVEAAGSSRFAAANETDDAETNDASLPDVRGAVRAFGLVRAWTDQLAAPPMESDAARAPIDGASGVCVIIRRAGRAIGSGVDTRADALMLRRAFGRALAELAGDPAFRKLDPEVQATVGRNLLIEVEIAGALTPMAGRSFKQLAEQLRPGLDGVTLRYRDERAMAFPSMLAVRNVHSGDVRTILPLVADLGLGAMEFGDLVRRHRVSAYRFATVHLAQEAPTGEPFHAHRGERIVDSSDVTTESLATKADARVTHNNRRMQATTTIAEEAVVDSQDEERGHLLAGDYDAALDRYERLFALPIESALTAYALARHAANAQRDDEARQQQRRLAARLIADLDGPRNVDGRSVTPIDSAAVAALIAATAMELETGGGIAGVRRTFLDEAAARTRAAFDPTSGSFADVLADGERGEPLDPHQQAVVAMVLAQMSTGPEALVSPQLARQAIDAAWSSVEEVQAVHLLPWIGWAEQVWHDAAGEGGDAGGAAAVDDARARLRALIDALDAARISAFDVPDEPDIVGGFRLATDGDARPTAQTVRPAGFIASALRDPWLMPNRQRIIAMARHMETMRFVRQLVVRDDLAGRLPNGRLARGGIRNALWDRTQPAAAQPMALLCVTETILSLEAAKMASEAGPRSRE